MLPVAILCGGLATRMLPRTEKIPKALLPVCGEPFLFRQLRLLRSRGVRQVVLCTGHLGEQIRLALAENPPEGLDVRFSDEGEAALGTGGALKNALPLLGERFMVVYGDSWLDMDYADAARAFLDSGLPAMMAVYENENRWDASNVILAAGKVSVYDKKKRLPEMKWIDYGAGCLERRAFNETPEKFDLAELYGRLACDGQLGAYVARNRFYEIGSFAGLEELEKLLGRKKGA